MPTARAAVRALVAQLSAAQRALEAGDLGAAREAAEAVLSADPGNAAARQVLDRIASAGQPQPAVTAVAPSPSGPHDSVDGAAWSTFELRVRARRAERCAARVREAHERGDAEGAQSALQELEELAPDDERIASLTALLAAPSVPEPPANAEWDANVDVPGPLTADEPDWSDTWLDEPRLSLELDPPSDHEPAARFSQSSLLFASPKPRKRRSRTLAVLAVAACAIAAAGTALWLSPETLRLRSLTDLLRPAEATEESAEAKSPTDGPTDETAAQQPPAGTSPSMKTLPSSPVEAAQQAPPTMPPAATEAVDESAVSARNDALPAAATVPEPTIDRTPSRPEADAPAATAGTTPPSTGSTAAARAATDNLIAAERRDARLAETPSSPTSTPAVGTPPPSQAARLTSPPSTQQASPPVVSGAGSLPGVSSPISAVQPYVPPPAPPPAVAATARNADAPPPRDDAALVRAAIEGYRRAYNSLDAGAAARVWPTVDAAALGRAFKQLRSQSLTFDRCAVTIGGELARVECDGRSEWVPGVGDRSPRTAPRTWHFDLSRADRAWTIVRVNVSQ